jgi:hypothetical protein
MEFSGDNFELTFSCSFAAQKEAPCCIVPPCERFYQKTTESHGGYPKIIQELAKSMAPMVWGYHMAVCQNLVPLVNIKIAGKWMFIPLKMYL